MATAGGQLCVFDIYTGTIIWPIIRNPIRWSRLLMLFEPEYG